MKLILTAMKFYFDGEDAEYMVQYEPMDKPGTYDVGVFRNGNYIISFNAYMSANKSHAKEYVLRAIEEMKKIPA